MRTKRDDGGIERHQGLLALVMSAIVIVGGIDLISDGPEQFFGSHGLIDLALLALSLGTAIFLWRSWLRTHHRLKEVDRALQERKSERDAWRARTEKIVSGLGQAIDDQLQEWGLTPTERETAMLLLKGLSHRDIATLTDRSERTVRQHAVAVYRKSGLSGRAELSAFFLEDLLLPMPEIDPTPLSDHEIA